MKYLGRRLLRAGLLLVGVSALCFVFTEMAPGSFFDEMRLNPRISPETISALRARYGLDQPLAVRYARWMAALAHGDFGYSIAYNTPVAPLLWARAKNTLLLTGMRSLGFQELSMWGQFHDIVQRMLLPTLVLVLASIAVIERHVRSSVLEVLEAPYIQAARGLGIGRTRLLFRHVLPVAANPAISLFGFSLAGLLSGSLLVEVVTGWPGLGPLILDATLSRDLYLVIGGVMFSAVFMVAGNFIADLLLLASDPRIRAGESDAN